MLDLSKLSRQEKAEVSAILRELDRRKARTDPVFFIETYLKTFDPRPEAAPHHLDFVLYPFQKEYVLGLVKAIREGYDLFDEKSRDMGVSWLALAVRFWLWLFEDGYQGLVGSRKEDYVDNGTLDSLFGKLDYFIQNIRDPLILPLGFDVSKHRTYMKLVNPANGNVVKGESSNKNFSRGGRYKDVFFDEFGFWPDARNSWTAAGDATHCRHAVTTPPDEPSYARTLRFSDKVKVRTWHWHLHPHKDEAWYKYEQSRRTQEEVLHELDISWEYSNTGRPYPEISTVTIGRHHYDPEAPLYISIDLGLDAIALGWYQPIKNSGFIKLIEAFEVSDKIIDWCLPMFGLNQYLDEPICSLCGRVHNFIYTDEELAFIAQVKDWQPTAFFGDPSGKQKHVESGISAYSILYEHGIDVQVNEQENEWVSRRDSAKRMLPKLVVNDTPRTQWWLECMKNARYPKRDEATSQAVNEVTKPVHDWTSHHRTQFEFFCVNYKGEHSASANPITAISPRPNIPPAFVAGSDGFAHMPDLNLEHIARSGAHPQRNWRNY
jgi:hypothetical protein